MTNKKAFTLAEVLITLAIIGVVAAMMIGAIANMNPDNKANAAKANKTLTAIDGAIKQVVIFNTNKRSFKSGIVCSAGGSGNACLRNLMGRYLNYSKTCDSGTGCLEGAAQTAIANVAFANLSYATLGDGALIGVLYNGACNTTSSLYPNQETSLKTITNTCGYVFYDVNGTKKPNMLGKDRFVVPIGNTRLKFVS